MALYARHANPGANANQSSEAMGDSGTTYWQRRLLSSAVALAMVGMLGTASGSATPSLSSSAQSPRAATASADTLRDAAAKRLAQIDGTIDVPGLDSAVEVRRDRW